MYAAKEGHVDVVEVLLRHGAEVQPGRRKKRAAEDGAPGDVNQNSPSGSPTRGANKERHGTTPLHLAVAHADAPGEAVTKMSDICANASAVLIVQSA